MEEQLLGGKHGVGGRRGGLVEERPDCGEQLRIAAEELRAEAGARAHAGGPLVPRDGGVPGGERRPERRLEHAFDEERREERRDPRAGRDRTQARRRGEERGPREERRGAPCAGGGEQREQRERGAARVDAAGVERPRGEAGCGETRRGNEDGGFEERQADA